MSADLELLADELDFRVRISAVGRRSVQAVHEDLTSVRR
jgi:hypothetical protein